MDRQRLITDARRRAKALSRNDGRPYQTHLDEIAQTAGRADWKAFVIDPGALPEASAAIRTTATEATPTAGNRSPRSRLACIAGAMLAAAMPIAAAAAILADSDRMNEASSRVAAEASMLAHVHAPLVGFQQNRTFPARIEIRSARRRIVTLAFTDMRVAGASRLLRHLPGHEPVVFVGDQLGGRLMRDALSEGAVMRLVVEVDCGASTVRYLRYEAATDMSSGPTFARDIPEADRVHPIRSAQAVKDVCIAAATPAIRIT